MNKLKKHIFICENIREAGSPKKSCGLNGGKEIREQMKNRIGELGLHKTIRVNSAGCLGACNNGPVAVVYPKGTWYGSLTTENIEEIIQTDLINGEVVTELEITDDK
ncbi:MAG: (2Fe-2S) ferredoxin domain-containing protein [Melioribacteraceae bacterium]|jgi:(2Fe-2S) ferredoxin|nr:(2Fe-2S) ferredoxin domain-containing protein [Melioribacteraceae bacterium]